MSEKRESQDLGVESLTEEQAAALVEQLEGPSRRDRQNAASKLAECCKQDPEWFASFAGAFVDALNRPEAQTRWECLDMLTLLVPFDSRSCDKAVPGAETALFDEDSGPVRLAAMRFLCKLGATTESRSERVWPLVDEAMQCYHGDYEYQNMLSAVVEFSEGKLAAPVGRSLAARVAFDAENSRGALRRKSQQILENLK